MPIRQQQDGRLGNLPAMVRAARWMRMEPGESADGEPDHDESLEASADSGHPPVDAVTRKRRLVAMFCKMLGEQLLEGRIYSLGEPLSPRQRQTLQLLLQGSSEKEISVRLAISRHTVHVYVKALYKRFNVSSRGELLAKWVNA